MGWRRTHSRRHCGYLHGRSKGKGAVNRTRYGRTRISTKSFFIHHTQQMAKAAVMYDARAILKRVSVLKQQRLRTQGRRRTPTSCAPELHSLRKNVTLHTQ